MLVSASTSASATSTACCRRQTCCAGAGTGGGYWQWSPADCGILAKRSMSVPFHMGRGDAQGRLFEHDCTDCEGEVTQSVSVLQSRRASQEAALAWVTAQTSDCSLVNVWSMTISCQTADRALQKTDLFDTLPSGLCHVETPRVILSLNFQTS